MNARWGAPAVGFEVALSHAPLSPVTRKELCPLWDGACVPAGVLCTHWPLGGDHVRCSHCTLRSARVAFSPGREHTQSPGRIQSRRLAGEGDVQRLRVWPPLADTEQRGPLSLGSPMARREHLLSSVRN